MHGVVPVCKYISADLFVDYNRQTKEGDVEVFCLSQIGLQSNRVLDWCDWDAYFHTQSG